MELPDWAFLDEAMPYLDLTKQVRRLDKRIQQAITEATASYVADLLADVDECETPIEELLCVALNIWQELLCPMRPFRVGIYPQAAQDTPGGKYRTDFTVALEKDRFDRAVSVHVECDGHDFHEKTKAQAARDKKRDRDLGAAGTPVLHFTGSEIWRDPGACAREVIARLRGRWSELYGDR